MVMEGVWWRDGSQEVTKPMAIGLKMEDVLQCETKHEIFFMKESNQDNNQDRKMRDLWPFQAPNDIGTKLV